MRSGQQAKERNERPRRTDRGKEQISAAGLRGSRLVLVLRGS
jgi:hypothetical protein